MSRASRLNGGIRNKAAATCVAAFVFAFTGDLRSSVAQEATPGGYLTNV
jgi:hypothetical protein